MLLGIANNKPYSTLYDICFEACEDLERSLPSIFLQHIVNITECLAYMKKSGSKSFVQG